MKLFEPGRIGRLSIKNRIVLAPMNAIGLADPDGRLSQRGIDYHVAQAKGGTGMIITGAACVSRELEELPGIIANGDIHVTVRLNELAEAVHDYGANAAIQLTAGHGRVIRGFLLQYRKPIAPSSLPCF
jgi:2-enoate reductase